MCDSQVCGNPDKQVNQPTAIDNIIPSCSLQHLHLRPPTLYVRVGNYQVLFCSVLIKKRSKYIRHGKLQKRTIIPESTKYVFVTEKISGNIGKYREISELKSKTKYRKNIGKISEKYRTKYRENIGKISEKYRENIG